MSKIFWESCERVYHKQMVIINPFSSWLMSARAAMYAQKIRAVSAMLPGCVGFINVTKIHICRPGGHNSIQKSVYSEQKRMNCLLFCKDMTPHGLFFAMVLLRDEDTIYFY